MLGVLGVLRVLGVLGVLGVSGLGLPNPLAPLGHRQPPLQSNVTRVVGMSAPVERGESTDLDQVWERTGRRSASKACGH